MSEIIPSPKELFGSISMPLREAPPLRQELRDRFMHVARVVIENPEHDGEVLFSQRENGLWHLPGGQAELGQSCNIAGEDETEQEIGLQISLEDVEGDIFEMQILGEDGPKKHIGKLKVSTVFAVTSYNGEPTPLDETRAVAWQRPDMVFRLGEVRPDTYTALATTGHFRAS